jgi:hypothetical protein
VSRRLRLGIILAGYVAAFLAAGAALHFRQLHAAGGAAQGSAGMYAFGDALLYASVLVAVALVPTALALHELRSLRWFWTGLSVLSTAVTATGAVAAAVVALASHPLPGVQLTAALASAALLRVLAAPLLILSDVTLAFFAPGRDARRALLVGTVIEAALVVFLLLFLGTNGLHRQT